MRTTLTLLAAFALCGNAMANSQTTCILEVRPNVTPTPTLFPTIKDALVQAHILDVSTAPAKIQIVVDAGIYCDALDIAPFVNAEVEIVAPAEPLTGSSIISGRKTTC